MGKPAGRLGDFGSGHGKCPPTPVTSGSGDVTTNGRPAARLGDSLAPHCKHGRSIAAGSGSVSINGRPAARVGDGISCAGNVVSGSSNVTIGDAIVLSKPSDASIADLVFRKRGAIGKVSHAPKNPSQPLQQIASTPKEDIEIEEYEHIPEFKDAVIRIDILPEQATDDSFTIAATDGSYSVTKTVKDDLIPGDSYIDLLFAQLDTSKQYRLTHHHPETGKDYLYFDNVPYGNL